MSEIEIPDRAVKAAYASPYNATHKVIQSVLELGGPLVVAAELRRFAADLNRRAENPLSRRIGEFRAMAEMLIDRADELDPQGGTR